MTETCGPDDPEYAQQRLMQKQIPTAIPRMMIMKATDNPAARTISHTFSVSAMAMLLVNWDGGLRTVGEYFLYPVFERVLPMLKT